MIPEHKMANADKNKSEIRWKYLFDSRSKALIRLNGTTYEYYDVYAGGWFFDSFGSDTFSGYSKDSIMFHEVSARKIPGIITKISPMDITASEPVS
jgi:hypothetical protein